MIYRMHNKQSIYKFHEKQMLLLDILECGDG